MSASPLQRIGLANLVTAFRLGLVLRLWTVPTTDAWTMVFTATIAAALDGVDGALARGRGEVSRFGARFDMETDAFLIVTLSVLVWRLDKAGAWVLLAGALRYLFVAAAWIGPWMANDLPESWRRKVTCVVQIATLIAAIAPVVPQPWSAIVAGAGLVLLTWSFAVDVQWLARHRDL